MDNLNDIQILLDRYWEGETTLEEERALKAYFASSGTDGPFAGMAHYFQAVREEQVLQSRAATIAPMQARRFAWRSWVAAASVTLVLTAAGWWLLLQRSAPAQQQVVSTVPTLPADKGIPADAALAPASPVTATAENLQTRPARKHDIPLKRSKRPQATPTLDPETEQAMEEIKAALALVSSKIRKGRQEAARGATHLDNVDKLFKIKSEG
jgi:hypothetical protein